MRIRRSRRNPPLVVFGNPPKFTRQDFKLIAEIIRDIAPSETSVRSRNQIALAFANALQRTNPRFNRDAFLAACGVTDEFYMKNPPRFRDLALSVDVCEIRYKHAQDGKYYKHKFKPKQVQIWTHPNSKTATLKRVDGKPLIGEY